ncbi:hypothetical protein B0A67_02375 [Flavobacterium aquidurense]|uniref:hypothetical protein n=1 Tax=Flavobacterium aquidurense TaxID=362413 RepID=UPI00091BF313|nr:hypothetical protein [Flavobacterium aquidurense]OXA73922.1 hypothetical protein B0A67_02375 [Flavobacterium aquidurense]SHH40622.1 hypothetical protein SAMN05444481_11694 [Flavobacterium frigidimaris]
MGKYIKRKDAISVSLTDFIDFVNKSGGSKMTKVKQVKNRPPYNPATDFYKALREEIIDTHKNNDDKKRLDNLLQKLTDSKKIANYPSSIDGYKKFWGKKKTQWFNPPFYHWLTGDLDIKINPELGLAFDKKYYVIKLFLKADKISKDKLSQILSLMESQLRKEAGDQVIFAVLDVKNSKLYENTKDNFTYLPLLEGEAKSFESICKAI